VNYRAGGVMRRQVIGRHGGLREDGHPWNATTARQRARELLGKVAGGADPSAEVRRRHGGATLRDAMGLHLDGMRAKERSARSIETIEREMRDYLDTWLDRPLVQISRSECREYHRKVSEENGPYIANRIMRHVRAIWNTALKEHELPANPTIAVQWNKEHRRQEPIPWENLPAWHATVTSLEPIIEDGKRIGARPGVRGDYQMFVLLTGLRRMDAATVRWDHLDLEHARLHRPNPKGGKDRAFTIPLSTTCVEILERRRRENVIAFPDGDGGWVFPTRAIKDKPCVLCSALGLPGHAAGSVIHLVEGKQQKIERSTGKATRILPSPHRLRDTYTTACAEVGGLSGYVIDVLTNHRPPRGTVTAGYIDLSPEHLAECQERVTSFLLARMKPSPTTGRESRRASRRHHLKAV
jgi:integrase